MWMNAGNEEFLHEVNSPALGDFSRGTPIFLPLYSCMSYKWACGSDELGNHTLYSYTFK